MIDGQIASSDLYSQKTSPVSTVIDNKGKKILWVEPEIAISNDRRRLVGSVNIFLFSENAKVEDFEKFNRASAAQAEVTHSAITPEAQLKIVHHSDIIFSDEVVKDGQWLSDDFVELDQLIVQSMNELVALVPMALSSNNDKNISTGQPLVLSNDNNRFVVYDGKTTLLSVPASIVVLEP